MNTAMIIYVNYATKDGGYYVKFKNEALKYGFQTINYPLEEGIAQSHAVVHLVSPSWFESDICQKAYLLDRETHQPSLMVSLQDDIDFTPLKYDALIHTSSEISDLISIFNWTIKYCIELINNYEPMSSLLISANALDVLYLLDRLATQEKTLLPYVQFGDHLVQIIEDTKARRNELLALYSVKEFAHLLDDRQKALFYHDQPTVIDAEIELLSGNLQILISEVDGDSSAILNRVVNSLSEKKEIFARYKTAVDAIEQGNSITARSVIEDLLSKTAGKDMLFFEALHLSSIQESLDLLVRMDIRLEGGVQKILTRWMRRDNLPGSGTEFGILLHTLQAFDNLLSLASSHDKSKGLLRIKSSVIGFQSDYWTRRLDYELRNSRESQLEKGDTDDIITQLLGAIQTGDLYDVNQITDILRIKRNDLSSDIVKKADDIHVLTQHLSTTQDQLDLHRLSIERTRASAGFSSPVHKLKRLENLLLQVNTEIVEAWQKVRHIALSLESSTEATRDTVNFGAYTPRHISKGIKYSVIVYAYLDKHKTAISNDSSKFSEELGATSKFRMTADSQSLARSSQISIVPQADHVNFEPATLTKTWDGDWIRFIFDFKVPDDFPEEELWLRISIRIKGLEVAHIKSSSEIASNDTSVKELSKMPDNPLAQAMELGDLHQHIAKPYRNVFISYSRKDQEFALQRAAEIERILGDKVFLDVKSMRAGQHWQQELAKAIRDADIFHLLWSEHSAESKYCRYEWDYALKHKCPDNMCVGVIRPVYWLNPMPTPPDELAHLHFEYINPNDEVTETEQNS